MEQTASAIIEQAYSNTAYYIVKIVNDNGKKRLINKPIEISDLTFHKPIIVTMYALNDMTYLQPENSKKIYTFRNNIFCGFLNPDENTKYYRWKFHVGIVKYGSEYLPYWCIDEPEHSQTPSMIDFTKIMLPPMFTGFKYDMNFEYDHHLIDILHEYQASLVDEFKRPLDINGIKRHQYYPGKLADSTATVKDVVGLSKTLPIVVNLESKNEGLACLDLEPHFTEEDLNKAESFDYYYVEETPRGGRHYLIKAKQKDAYKFRISKYLEVQVNAPITLYGINGIWKKDNIKLSDLSEYKEVGHESSTFDETENPEKAQLIAKAYCEFFKYTGSRIYALSIYHKTDDLSYADFTAMARLYHRDIQFNVLQYPRDLQVWILADYASLILPHRAKHDELRLGVPYLTYLADKIVTKDTNDEK